MKHRVKGGILATVGYILSPLSWWNDIVVNLPLAYAFAFPFGLISRNLFLPMMILGYWITNVAGLILVHQGLRNLVSSEKGKYIRRELARDIVISVIYTIVVVMFARIGWLRFPLEYFD